MLMSKLKLPSKVLIAGRYWSVEPFSKTRVDKDIAKNGLDSFGECHVAKKTIKYHPMQHPEELMDTLLHEGLHAILVERSHKFGQLGLDEDIVPLLTSDILGFLKQITEIKLK